MDHRQVARTIAYGRVIAGVAFTAAPRTAGRQWIGDAATEPSAALLLRAFGIRDLALGLGTLGALSSGEPSRTWVALSAASDAVDAAATLLALRRVPARKALPIAVVATICAALGVSAAGQLD